MVSYIKSRLSEAIVNYGKSYAKLLGTFKVKNQCGSTKVFVKAIFGRLITGYKYKKRTSTWKYLVGLYRLVLANSRMSNGKSYA